MSNSLYLPTTGPIIYLAQWEDLYKIGRTRNWEKRRVPIQTEATRLFQRRVHVSLVHAIPLPGLSEVECVAVERIVRRHYWHAQVAWREWFRLSAEEVEGFCQVVEWPDSLLTAGYWDGIQ